MKKLLRLAVLVICFISGCQPVSQASEDKPLVIVTTPFLQDMVTNIAGDTVTVKTIIPAGEDPHLYVAKSQDLGLLQQGNLVLYHGLHFEGKMSDALSRVGIAVSKDFAPEDLTYMTEDGTAVVDPHFWFDIARYKQAVQVVYQELRTRYPKEQSHYEENLTAYLAQLDALDAEIREKLATIPEDQRILITPHDAFNYLAKVYGVTVHAPQGVSTEAEVSNQSIQETVDVIVKHRVKAIFSESTTDPQRMQKLQEAVRAQGWDVVVVNGSGETLFSDSLAPRGETGDSFIEMYRHNIDLMVKYLK